MFLTASYCGEFTGQQCQHSQNNGKPPVYIKCHLTDLSALPEEPDISFLLQVLQGDKESVSKKIVNKKKNKRAGMTRLKVTGGALNTP